MSMHYRMGIDVGLKSVGLAAIAIDDSSCNPLDAIPMKLLSVMSVVHDGGIDPDGAKTDTSRMSSAGVARRARRLRKRATARKKNLQKLLEKYGFDFERANAIGDLAFSKDPYFSWYAREQAASSYIPNETQRNLAIAISLMAIGNHRGWRNPYSSINMLKGQSLKPSSFYLEFANELMELNRIPANTDINSEHRLTPAQLVVRANLLSPDVNFRGNPANRSKNRRDRSVNLGITLIPLGKLHQSDYYYEARTILEMQHVDETAKNEFLTELFSQINPKDVGAAASKVARDDLQPSLARASKASLEFQRFRILTTLQNIRIKTNDSTRRLSADELVSAYEYLCSEDASLDADLSWDDVALHISPSLKRSDLTGVGGITEDGEPISSKRPPVLTTQSLIVRAGKKEALRDVSQWWARASDDEKEMFINFLGNVGASAECQTNEEIMARNSVDEEMSRLEEDSLAELEKISIPAGRAKYSINTMRRLNHRMLHDNLDLHDARMREFGVASDWKPSAEELGTPTGNPAVDRTLRIVSRWVRACVDKWGIPESVNIEHVRDGFMSPKAAREYDKKLEFRYKENKKIREEIVKALSEEGSEGLLSNEYVRRSDIRKWQALQRQNCQCAYCGRRISFFTAQMDHIVPRKGAGSTNTLDNLVATCANCNKEKSNTLYSVWATAEQRKATIERVKHWNRDSYFANGKEFEQYKRAVIARLNQTVEDEPIDNRSIESVAWMARCLSEQIEGYLIERSAADSDPGRKNSVHVYRGWITAEARRASGIENELPWLGGASGKTRLDRRHHAIDAAVIAFLRPAVAQVLVERDSMRRASLDLGRDNDWKTYCGGLEEHSIYLNWRDNQMTALGMLLCRAMLSDKIAVTSPLRLKLSRGKVHEDTVQKAVYLRVGDAMTSEAIDKALSPAVWGALTHQPDYDPATGLAENNSRVLNVHGKVLPHDSKIGFMSDKAKLMKREYALRCPVRGGYANLGDSIHHARIFRIPGSRGKGFRFAMMRVAEIDLARYRDADLFSVQLPMQSISVRFADDSLKAALRDGTAEYLGWLVVNDELVINPDASLFSPKGKQAINLFMRAFPGTRHFKVTGFPQRSKIKIEAQMLSSEGLPDLSSIEDDAERSRIIEDVYGGLAWTDDEVDTIRKAFGAHAGLLLSVDVLFATKPLVVRRSTLGYPRWRSKSNMPLSWTVE